uniref:Transmembrane protein n=1 Tax=Mesocestoides corti TaxID=53468 RepID=A0A5K3EU54_MESCO
MEFRALHPSCLFLMLLSEATLCQSKAQQDQRWGIEQDINRLLADDIGLNRDDTNNWLNNTEAANISSSENVTSYWHLPADAPLPEPSTLDSLRSQATTKDFNQIQKSEALLRHCPRLKILPFRPIYEFVACACWCLLFGLLSSAWMVLLCGKRSKTNRSTQGDVYMFKCKLILGLNIHASGHRLHLPFLSRVTHDYTCQHEQFPMKPSTTAHIASTITEMIPAAVALFTSPVVSGLQLACSAVAAAAIGLWILSIALNENRFLPRAQTAGMLIAISLFYTATLVGYNSRLTLASAITTRNTYIPGEVKRETSGRVCSTSSDAKLSPRELLEIPKFTRTQFFDTLSVSPNEQTDQCCSNRSVQIITVYEPVVD